MNTIARPKQSQAKCSSRIQGFPPAPQRARTLCNIAAAKETTLLCLSGSWGERGKLLLQPADPFSPGSLPWTTALPPRQHLQKTGWRTQGHVFMEPECHATSIHAAGSVPVLGVQGSGRHGDTGCFSACPWEHTGWAGNPAPAPDCGTTRDLGFFNPPIPPTHPASIKAAWQWRTQEHPGHSAVCNDTLRKAQPRAGDMAWSRARRLVALGPALQVLRFPA